MPAVLFRFKLAILSAILGVLFITLGFVNLWQVRTAQDWQSVVGVVSLSEIRSHQRGPEDRYFYLTLRYDYEVDGAKYQGNRVMYGDWYSDSVETDGTQTLFVRLLALLAGQWSQPAKMYGSSYLEDILVTAQYFPLGERVTVHYDPDDPKDAVLLRDESGETGRAFVIGFIFLVIALVRALWTLVKISAARRGRS